MSIAKTGLALFTAIAVSGAANAVTFVSVEAAGVQNTTLAAMSGVETFDSVSGYTSPYVTSFGGSSYSGSFDAVLPSDTNVYGGAGGTGRYITVQGVTILDVTGPNVDYFGLWASALDGGNAVSFYKGGALVDTISLVSQPLDSSYSGNPNTAYLGQNTGEKYAFFNFVVVGGYDQVRIVQNNGGGFELDNVTVGTAAATVPEPASWAMLIAGFGLVGAGMRRRRSVIA